MEIEFKKVRFSIPPGYADETSYSFRDKEEKELVEVNYGRTRPSAPDLAGIMDDLLSQVRDAYGDKVRISPVVPSTLASRSALQASDRISDENGSHNEWWAIAMLDSEHYVHVSYGASSAGEKAIATFDYIRKSVAQVESAPRGAAASPDYVRYTAGRIAVDVPRSLDPPKAYLFVSADRKSRITVSVSEPPQPAARSLSDEVTAEARYGAVVSDQRAMQKAGGDGSMEVIRYSLTKPGVPVQLCLRGRRTFTGGTTVHVDASLDQPSSISLERDVVSLLESLVAR